MNKLKLLFSILVISTLTGPQLHASANVKLDTIQAIQDSLSPHAPFYSRKTVIQDLADPSKQLDAAKFLYKEVEMDKDYLAAKAILHLTKFNSQVTDFLKETSRGHEKIRKALELGKNFEIEREEINGSISQALVKLNSSQNPKVRQAAEWLKKPIPLDRIRCCAEDLVSLGKPTSEVNEILKILKTTQFGDEQVKKVTYWG